MTRKITLENALEILKENSYKTRNDLRISKYDNDKYYALANGNIIIVFDDDTHAVLFENEKDYSDFSKKVNSVPYYILDQFPNNEKDYIELVKHSKIILEEKFKTKVSDFSYESLQIFDSAIAKNRITYEFYFSDVYYYLVPFATEVVIKESNSQLKLFYSTKHDTVEPHILLNDARIINIFIDLYEIPMESWETFRIYNTVQLRLDKL